jgi:hypothetical protein
VSTTINDPDDNFPNTFTGGLGHFTAGITAPNTGLPTVNGGPAATYAGGIDIDTGVGLSTGLLRDNFDEQPRGNGVEGPNNGISIGGGAPNEGEISVVVLSPGNQPFQESGKDEDFVLAVFGHVPEQDRPGGGDAAVLKFDVTTNSPGFLRISFVFGSDEAPFFLNQEFNDSFAILIDGENIATIAKSSGPIPFTLQDIEECDELYVRNDVAPEPNELDGSQHGSPGEPLFDIEFGGFTKKLTRETKFPLAPGTHTVKIVIQDVEDRRLDSALFVETDSLKLFPLQQGDYNGDGVVDAADYVIWRDNQGVASPSFYDGDGNNDGLVNDADYQIWRANFGFTGNKDFCSDLNRDGVVNFSDSSNMVGGITECASRFEGDFNGDGAVNMCDAEILQAEWMSGMPLNPCACGQQMAGGGGEMMLALDSVELAELKNQIPKSADMDGDGTVDEHDIAALDAAIYGAFDKMKAANDDAAANSESQPEPTLAEPQPEFPPTREAFGPVNASGSSTNEGLEPVPAQPGFPPGFPVPDSEQ